MYHDIFTIYVLLDTMHAMIHNSNNYVVVKKYLWSNLVRYATNAFVKFLKMFHPLTEILALQHVPAEPLSCWTMSIKNTVIH